MQTCKKEGKSNLHKNYVGMFPNMREKGWGDVAWAQLAGKKRPPF